MTPKRAEQETGVPSSAFSDHAIHSRTSGFVLSAQEKQAEYLLDSPSDRSDNTRFRILPVVESLSLRESYPEGRSSVQLTYDLFDCNALATDSAPGPVALTSIFS